MPLKFGGTSSDTRLVKGVLNCANGHLYQVKDEIPILKDAKLSEKEFVWKVEFPNIDEYNKLRKKYASYLSEKLREVDEAMINAMVARCSKEKFLLDVASGMGSLLTVLAQQLGEGQNVLGTDVDEKPLRGAKFKLEEQKCYNQVSLCVMDAKHLAVESQKIPCVTSFFGLDNIREVRQAFQEVSRVLTPNGRLIMATLWLEENSRSLALAEKLNVGGIATEDRLAKMLEETMFEIDTVERFHSGKWGYNPMDALPIEGDWFAHTLVRAHKKGVVSVL
jgi:ubiquinone/menaquinone biosynthesis C-methylase UbiE